MAATPETNDDRGPAHRRSAWLLVLGAVLVGAVASGGAMLWRQARPPGPEAVVAAFLQATYAQDTCRLRELVDSPTAARMQDDPDYRGGTGSFSNEWTLGAATIDGDRATVPVTIKLPPRVAEMMKGQSQIGVTMVTVREQGQWKVDLPATRREWYDSLQRSAGLEPSEPGGRGKPGGLEEPAVPRGQDQPGR